MTTSGATAVQIVHSSCRGSDIEHFGSAHDEVELEAAEALGMTRRSSTGRSASTAIVAPAGVGPGSGSGRCGASDSDVPGATREIQRPNSQEESCPSVDAVREANEDRGGR